MGKIRSAESSSLINSLHQRARSKKKDTSGTTGISAAIKQKFAWILHKKPVVLCEKLHDSKVPTVSETSKSHTWIAKRDKDNPDSFRSPQIKLKRSKNSTFSKTNEPKKFLTPKAALKNSSSQALQVRSKGNNATVYDKISASTSACKDYPPASQERINDVVSVSGSIVTTEGGSSEEELKKFLDNTVEKFAPQSKVKPKICTSDPTRVTPCCEECCMQPPKGGQCRKKKSKKKENRSSSSKRETNSQGSKAHSSQSMKPVSQRRTVARSFQSTQIDSQKKRVASPVRKRTKDEKPRTIEQESSQKQVSQKQNGEVAKVTLTSTTSKLALFTLKNRCENGSLYSLLSPIRSPPIATITKCGGNESNNTMVSRYLIRQNSGDHSRPGSSFSLEALNITNVKSQGSTNHQSLQGKSDLFSKPLKNNFETSFDANPVLSKRTKPKEYFTGLDFRGICVSETKTTHPKASVNSQNQNHILEGATFPKARVASHSSNQSSFEKFKQNYGSNSMRHISPLSCEENEMTISPQTNCEKNRMNAISNGLGVQNFSNQQNVTEFLKNSVVPQFSSTKPITNYTEYYEKDRFRRSAKERVRGNGGNILGINPDETVNEFKAGGETCTTSSEFFCSKEEPLLETQVPYFGLQQGTTEAPLENSRVECTLSFPSKFELSNDSQKMNEMNAHVEEHIIRSILPPKKELKITKNETVSPDFIQVLPRLQTSIRNGNLSLKGFEGNSQTFAHRNSADDHQKIAMIKINSAAQLQKDDSHRDQKSVLCDDVTSENLLNFGLTATQASAMLNSNMVPHLDNVLQHDFGLLNLTGDDLLGDDMVNNNEKMFPQSNEHIDISQPIEIQESESCLNIDNGSENNEKMVTKSNGYIDVSHPVRTNETNSNLNVVNGSQTLAGNSSECTGSEGPLFHIMKLLNDNPHPCRKPEKSRNKMSSFGDFRPMNNSFSDGEVTTYTASNFEDLNSVAGTSHVNQCSLNFKEPDWNSPNSANEIVNDNLNFSSSRRKRRWFDEKQKKTEQAEKKIKLKRRKWNQCANEGDFTDTSSEISSLYDADHNSVPVSRKIYYDNNTSFQGDKDTSDLNNHRVQNDSQLLNFTALLVRGEEKNISINERKVEAVVHPKVETKVQSRNETKFKPRNKNNVQLRIETKVQPNVETKVEPKFQRVESNAQTKEASPRKESLVDPKPEPEPKRGDSDSQPRKAQKTKNSPVRCKKRRSGHSSKFSPSYYSYSSSESSDYEFEKKSSSSSGDEIESKDKLLKLRLQRELPNFQEINENSNSLIINSPLTNEKDEEAIEDDILSVIASPSLIEMGMSSRCTSPVQVSKTVQSSDFSDTNDSYLDAFERKNQEECFLDLRSYVDKKRAEKIEAKNNQAGSSSVANNSDVLFVKPFAPLNNFKHQDEHLPNKNMIVFDPITVNRSPVSRVFYGVCHWFLNSGTCTKKMCAYEHKIPIRLQIFQHQREQDVFNIMHDGISARLQFFVQNVYKLALKRLSYDMCLKLFTEVCNASLMNEQLLYDTVEVLWQKEGPIAKAIKALSEQPLEQEISTLCLSQLLIIAENLAPKNEYWETLRPLTWRVQFSSYILEQILVQCINDRENEPRIEEVYDYLVRSNSYQGVRDNLWISFCKLRGELAEKRIEKLSENLNSGFFNDHHNVNQGIASPDRSPNQQRADHHSPLCHNGDYHSPQESMDMDICNRRDSDTSYRLMPIDDLPPPQSGNRERDNVWKFFDHLESLRNGLKHRDYQHVVSILKQYVNTERTLFIRHCHRMLSTEINKSQVHVDNIIKIAVQTGELFELREILYRLGTCILINLADQGLWVHAYELLKTLQTYNLHKNNAGFTLLAAEICLANHRSLKALTLLKQNNIIFTNCKKWKVASNEEDVHLRTSIVTLLLESLCQDFAEKAFFIFDLILGEQPSNSCPVDLTRIVDKLMLSLIAKNHTDLVMNLCKKAMRYHLNFHETTFRTIITTLVPIDLVLSRQFYQYATHLGIYSPVKVYPVTHVTINVDWSEEEMYIVVLEFLRKLFLNVGFAASHLGPNQLGVFFVFEVVPERKQLYYEDSDSKSSENQRINKSKSLMRDILQNRFDPPIRFVKREQGRICKIKSRSIVDYLKAGHISA